MLPLKSVYVYAQPRHSVVAFAHMMFREEYHENVKKAQNKDYLYSNALSGWKVLLFAEWWILTSLATAKNLENTLDLLFIK